MMIFITKQRNNIFIALAVLFWLIVWHTASVIIGYSFLLSSPLEVIKALFRLCEERAFWLSVMGSIARISSGFFSAFFVGILLACCAARIRFIKILLSPFMATIKSVPVASLSVIVLLWLSNGSQLAAVISFIMVLPLIYSTTINGILLRDKGLAQMATVFKIPFLRKLLYIDFPQVMPHILSVCAVAIGLAWKSGVAAEVIGIVSNSLGGAIYDNKLLFSTENVLAITVVIIFLSYAFEKLLMLALQGFSRAILQGRRVL